MKIRQTQGPGTKNNPIDLNSIDVSNIDSFYCYDYNLGLFEDSEFKDTRFEYIDISKWDVSNVQDMHRMFSGCKRLKSVGDLSEWDVSKVDDMSYMFYECKQLTSIGDLSHWDVRQIKNVYMYGMFYGSNRRLAIPDWYED